MEIEHFISIKVCSHLPHCLQEDTSTIRFLDIFLKFSLSWLSQQRVADCAKGHYHQSLIVFRRMHACVRYHIRERAKQQSCDLRCQCLAGRSNWPIAENFSMNVQLGIFIKIMNPVKQVSCVIDELEP